MLACAYNVKIGVIVGVRFERQKIAKKQTYMKTEACKLYSRDIWIFLPNITKIDHYNSELYRFKVGAFFETRCSYHITTQQCETLTKKDISQVYYVLWQLPPLRTYPVLQERQVGLCVPLAVSIVHMLQPSPHAAAHRYDASMSIH